MQKQIKSWISTVPQSTLTSYEKQLAYKMFLRPQLVYPLPCTTFNRKDIEKLFRPVLDEILHTLGINKHFPLDVVHGDSKYFGLEIDNAYFLQGISHLKFFLGHTNMMDRTGDLLAIATDYVHMQTGLEHHPLAHPSTVIHKYVPGSWISNLAQFLSYADGAIDSNRPNVIKPQRENDRFIMQITLDEHLNVELIQQCRLYLQVCTLADIATVNGINIETIYRTQRGRHSILG